MVNSLRDAPGLLTLRADTCPLPQQQSKPIVLPVSFIIKKILVMAKLKSL